MISSPVGNVMCMYCVHVCIQPNALCSHQWTSDQARSHPSPAWMSEVVSPATKGRMLLQWHGCGVSQRQHNLTSP